MITKGERGRGINWEFKINRYTVLCIKQINSKYLLYNTENYIQYLVMLYNGAKSKKECLYVYIIKMKKNIDYFVLSSFLTQSRNMKIDIDKKKKDV